MFLLLAEDGQHLFGLCIIEFVISVKAVEAAHTRLLSQVFVASRKLFDTYFFRRFVPSLQNQILDGVFILFPARTQQPRISFMLTMAHLRSAPKIRRAMIPINFTLSIKQVIVNHQKHIFVIFLITLVNLFA